jgi:4-amino-4-deoxy-L-arabinose transferase-like glycosyltransferase
MPPIRLDDKKRYVCTLVVWFVVVAVVAGVWRNVPVIDDWTYAWSVEHLLHTGAFRVLDWSSTYPLSQTLWGAAWSAVFGFSFGSLRASTLILGIVCCAALYSTLRELDVPPRVAWTGALSLAVNPLFVFLSSSFMTDVPFITFTTLSLLCYVRAVKHRETRFVWWAGAWAMAAFLVRQVGVITPVAGLPLLLRPASERSKLTRLQATLALGVTWTAMVVGLVGMRTMLGTTSIMKRWMWNLSVWPSHLVTINAYLLVMIAFYILPALLARASAQGLWRRPRVVAVGLVATAALLFLIFRTIPAPLRPDQTWSVMEVGASRSLVDGGLPSHGIGWLAVPMRALGLLATALLAAALFARRGPIAACVSLVRDAAANFRIAHQDAADGWPRAAGPLLLYVGAYLVLTNLLWMYHDRYYLALVPPVVALALAGSRRLDRYPRPACAALAIFAVVGLVGTRDALRFNQSVRDAWQSLVDDGVPPSEIDAGYAWNGWALYAHPDNLGPGQSPFRDVPWVTAGRGGEFVISTVRLKGYAVRRELTWRSLPWPGPDRLYVLRMTHADAANENGSAAGMPQQ